MPKIEVGYLGEIYVSLVCYNKSCIGLIIRME